jgi:hypothetical protein
MAINTFGSAPQGQNMFGNLKDWECIHTRHDRCAHDFLLAIIAIANFRINQRAPSFADFFDII